MNTTQTQMGDGLTSLSNNDGQASSDEMIELLELRKENKELIEIISKLVNQEDEIKKLKYKIDRIF